MKPRIAVTMGDPRGVGAEIIVKAVATMRRFAQPIIFGHDHLLAEAASLLGRKWSANGCIAEPNLKVSRRSPKRRCGEASLAYIEGAVQAVQQGDCDAIVTAPLCKEHIHLAGCPHPGHTELLAALAGVRTQTYLMMTGPRLKVTLTTLHEPLRKVPALLTRQRVLRAIVLTDEVMKTRFGIRKPRLAMAGFNPHASEGGLFGNEEAQKLVPALRQARRQGIQIEGPLPGDTVFYRAVQGDFDAVVSLYHDQGLIPVKLLHFDEAVNMTLGLPFVRTSVDHGVAFDIAWQGKAKPNSLIAAAKLAARLVGRGTARCAPTQK